MASWDVIVVGAGLAGLSCARELTHAGLSVLLCEASNAPGGQVRTDAHEGLLLDRGFQVFLEAYPEAKRVLDYPSLELRRFQPGARIFNGAKCRTISDPLRNPLQVFETVFSGVGSLADKFRLLRLRSAVCRGSLPALLARSEVSALERLRKYGFSMRMVEQFFRPFFSGIFLERELCTSSRIFEFYFRMFAIGATSIPSEGMEAIPRQLANRLPVKALRFGARVSGVERGTVTLESGEQLHAPIVVLATDARGSSMLSATAGEVRESQDRSLGVYCLYFTAPEPPSSGGWLYLNGTGHGSINNLAVVSNINPKCAPRDRALISVSVLPDRAAESAGLELRVLEELQSWFGPQVNSWQHVRTYFVREALPLQRVCRSPVAESRSKRAPWLYRCGDYLETASINGALGSGRMVAEEILRDGT